MNHTPAAGTLIEGKYEILSKMKEGGMGSIYRVRHRLLDEVRVVKVMLPQLGSEAEYKQRFAQEAKMATRLKHPNIGTIHDFALDPDGTAYIVMEFIDGVNLGELLKTSGPPGVPLSLEITHQALSALGYLHRKNIVHRDIALDNLMLTRDEEDRPQVKLIDLGISKPLDKTIELTSKGVFLGKLKYSSPEQLGSLALGETLDARSDLYSLGVVLYELLTGRAPVSGDTPRELIGAHLFHPPIPFSTTDPEGRVPEEVRAVVLKALQKKREERFASAEEFDRAILSLSSWIGGPEVPEVTRRLLSNARASRGVRVEPVTPSAQDRLDQQFLAQTTPTPATARSLGLSAVPHDPAASEPTVADPTLLHTPPTDSRVLPTPPAFPEPPPLVAAPPAKRRLAPILLGTLAVAGGGLLGLLLWRSGSTEQEKAAVPSPAPIQVVPTAAEPPPSTAAPQEAAKPPSEPTTAPDFSRLARVAEQVRSRAASARQTAERSGAPERAAELHSSGRRREREGQGLLARGEYEEAVEAFHDAAGLFQQATAAALARRPTAAERIAEVQAPTARSEPPVAVAPTAIPEPPRPPTAAPTPRVMAGPSEEERIRETIGRYLEAQNTLNVDLYARVYPALSGARRRAVEQAFANYRSQQVEGEIRQVRVHNSKAEVRLYERRVAVPRVGVEQRDSRERVIHLEKRGDGWVITGL